MLDDSLAILERGPIKLTVDFHIFNIVRAHVDVGLQALHPEQFGGHCCLVTQQRRFIQGLDLARVRHDCRLEFFQRRSIGLPLADVVGIPVTVAEHGAAFQAVLGHCVGAYGRQTMLLACCLEHIVATTGTLEHIHRFLAQACAAAYQPARAPEQVAGATQGVERLNGNGAYESCGFRRRLQAGQPLGKHFARLGGFAQAEGHQAHNISAQVKQAIADVALHKIDNG